MIIRKFNESLNWDISDYFFDLTDSGDWIVKSRKVSNTWNNMIYVFISSPEIQKWYNREIDPLSNWGMSFNLEKLESSLEIKSNQISTWNLILKCINHFISSNGYEIVNIDHASIGTKSTGPLFPVDTIKFTLKEDELK